MPAACGDSSIAYASSCLGALDTPFCRSTGMPRWSAPESRRMDVGQGQQSAIRWLPGERPLAMSHGARCSEMAGAAVLYAGLWGANRMGSDSRSFALRPSDRCWKVTGGSWPCAQAKPRMPCRGSEAGPRTLGRKRLDPLPRHEECGHRAPVLPDPSSEARTAGDQASRPARFRDSRQVGRCSPTSPLPGARGSRRREESGPLGFVAPGRGDRARRTHHRRGLRGGLAAVKLIVERGSQARYCRGGRARLTVAGVGMR